MDTVELTLKLTPRDRLDLIDVHERLLDQHGDLLEPYAKALYCSYHTTAGYLEQGLCSRLGHSRESLEAYMSSFRTLFPPDADYEHDKLHLRTELSEEQRENEPLNADSHLTFIGSGLENCVTYDNQPDTPVYFIDLDGVYQETTRERKTTVVGYNREKLVGQETLAVPMSSHRVDSVNLMDERLGLSDRLRELCERYEIAKGRIDVSLQPDESSAALTVNEYETLLMQHDLAEVLRDPIRFMARKGKNMLRDPRAVRSKAKNYAKYDLVRFTNRVIDALGMNESLVERVIDKFIAAGASRRLRMKRSVSLMVNNTDERGHGSIIQGTYQSPILVQWRKPGASARNLDVSFVRFE
jgi:thiamine phosphate synthase YjbQ (UPF0047 family)